MTFGFFLFLFFQTSILADDVSLPVNPLEPSVDISSLKSFNQANEVTVAAILYVQGRGEKKNILIFPRMDTIIEVFSEDFSGKKDVKLGDIVSLEITSWSGKKDKGESFIFYPDRYVLTLKTGEKIYVNKNIPLFNTIRIESDKGGDVLFSFFYDYYKKGVWINRNEKSPEPVSSVPVKGCVTAFKLN